MKNLLRITYIIPISLLITILVWMYRYVWFVTETIPWGRIFVAFLGLIFTSILFAIESIKEKN